MKQKEIDSFLKYGYFMQYEKDEYPIGFTGINKNLYLGMEENELVENGKELFLKAISQEFETNKNHVIPLSGGLDSRALLAGLLEFTEAQNISTYTFGSPGTLDYDIGNLIAGKVGTNHYVFPLTNYTYRQNELIDISNRIDNQTMLFHHPPMWEIDSVFSNNLVWSGFIGDLVVGGHLPRVPIQEFQQAKMQYLNNNKYVRSISLSNSADEDFIDYINFEPISNNQLTYEEQIVFKERVKKLTAPHVLMKGYKYKTPFINNEFMNFMMSIEDKYRHNEYLFKEILLNKFPFLFKQITKTNHGLSLKASNTKVKAKKLENKFKSYLGRYSNSFINPYINYLDFRNGIRKREDLKRIFWENVKDLKLRNIIEEIDIEDLMQKHLDKEKNYADALIILTSLEINLKAQGMKTNG